MDSRESMSPLSSDTNTTSTPLRFDRSNRNINNDLNDRLVSDDSDSDESPKRNKNSNKKSHSRDSSQISKNQTESSKVQQTNKRKRDSKELSDQSKIVSRNVSSLSPAHETSLNFQEYDSVFLTDLIDLQKRISESTNTDLLQRIVDTIEESGLFNITNSTFDFDLMKLDKNTIRKIKTFFIS
jgi:YEATS domain-containing protein 1/3